MTKETPLLKFLKPRIPMPIDTSHKFENKESIRNYLHTAKLFSDSTKSNDESPQNKDENFNKCVNSTNKSEFLGLNTKNDLKRNHKDQNSASIRNHQRCLSSAHKNIDSTANSS